MSNLELIVTKLRSSEIVLMKVSLIETELIDLFNYIFKYEFNSKLVVNYLDEFGYKYDSFGLLKYYLLDRVKRDISIVKYRNYVILE